MIDNYNSKIQNELNEFLITEYSAPIIISYAQLPTDGDVNRLESLGVGIVYRCKYINSIQCGEVSKDLIHQIAQIDKVTLIELTPDIRPLLDTSTRTVKARESEEYSPDTAWELGFTGKGINIAVLDTGVDDGHPSLRDKFVAGVDFAGAAGRITPKDGSYNPDDDTGHGTAIAGVAMGTGGQEGTYMGVAPDARLIDVRVSVGRGGDFIQAIEWCIDNKNTDWNNNGPDEYDGIDIISISMGGEQNSDGSGSVCQIINQASNTAGLTVVVAVGNEGPNNDGIGNIAAADEAITVGNLNDYNTIIRDDDDVHFSSTRGPRRDDGDDDPYDELKPNVVAPGTNIMAPDFRLIGQNVQGYTESTGSSFSCPHVAGVCALMLEANPNLLPKEIAEILQDTSEAMGTPDEPELSDKYNYASGFGSVDAYYAVLDAEKYEPSNHKPVIRSVTASQKFVKPDEDVTITTVATDQDGDMLGYNYSATSGEFSGTGSEVIWTAPSETGVYDITVVVDDGILLSDPETVSVTVETDPTNHPPAINKVDVSKRVVEPGENTTITVTASDPDDDPIFYEYDADEGSIIGVGPVVNWIAPNIDGKYSIHITVNDGDLESSAETIMITVEGNGENKPPEIIDFTASPQVIQTGGIVQLNVEAYDPEGGVLQYIYTTSSGKISGQGANVTFTAPDTANTVLITTRIVDSGGLTDEDDLVVDVFQQNFAPQILNVRANPGTVNNDGSTEVLFTVRVADENGLDDIYRVTIDLSSLYGSENQKMYDNGKQGDSTRDDGIYSITYLIPKGVPGGLKRLSLQVKDGTGDVSNSEITLNVTSVSNDSDDTGILGTDLKLPGFESSFMVIALLGILILIMINRKKNRIIRR
jgi:serine protease AprX